MSDRVLVDTSVWISFFRRSNSDISAKLKDLLRRGSPAYSGIIATELYRGAKSKKETGIIEDLLSSIGYIETREEYYREAGELGYTLAQSGVTMGTVDLLIARTAIANNVSLFTLDKHFTSIARHSTLHLYK